MALLARVGTVTPRFVATLTISPTAVNANSIMKETYTATGLRTDMQVTVNQPSAADDGCRILDARCSAADTLELNWFNGTAASVALAASQALFVVAF